MGLASNSVFWTEQNDVLFSCVRALSVLRQVVNLIF